MGKKNVSPIVSGAGLLAAVWTDLDRAVRERGGSDEDLYRLNTPDGKDIIAKLADIIVASNGKAAKPPFPSEKIAAEYGCTVVEDVAPTAFKISDMEFISFLQSGENDIGGEEMRQRAVTLKGNLGLVDGKYLLDHQDEIPVEMRGKFIALPGTLLRSSGGDLRVACLCWVGWRWVLCFLWLDGIWCDGGRLARRK